MPAGPLTNLSDAIISIHPRFAEAILDGTKTVELRRKVPNISQGVRLWIYATSPLAAIVGTVTVQKIVRTNPARLWTLASKAAGVSKPDFANYYQGTDQAVGLFLESPRKHPHVGIAILKTMRPGFHPPQVLSRISEAEVEFLVRLVTKAAK